MTSYYWYDYETFGSAVSRDRPAQFAGVRTDDDLEVIDDPLVLYCRPAADYLPDPDACLIHGITPMFLLKKGLPESEFAHRIYEELSQPDTCAVGYNAIHFDHELTRFLFYRNLRDPYAWHWKNGNSRWDIIDLLRAAYALRPDGFEWPQRDDGAPSFRLEDVAAANGVEHESPHEALADVQTTIAIARLIKQKQPALFDYYLTLRDRRTVARTFIKPFVYVSSYIPAKRGCASLVAPICDHPTNSSAVVVYDLRYDPDEFMDLDPDVLRERLFASGDSANGPRPPLYTIKANACPFVAPQNVLEAPVLDRLELDMATSLGHYEKIRRSESFADAVCSAYERDFDDSDVDVDSALYSGGFIPDVDRNRLGRILAEDPSLGTMSSLSFTDPRITELAFRYRARNYPQALLDQESARWKEHCRTRHLSALDDDRTPLDVYAERIAELQEVHVDRPPALEMLGELAEYGEKLRRWLS